MSDEVPNFFTAALTLLTSCSPLVDYLKQNTDIEKEKYPILATFSELISTSGDQSNPKPKSSLRHLFDMFGVARSQADLYPFLFQIIITMDKECGEYEFSHEWKQKKNSRGPNAIGSMFQIELQNENISPNGRTTSSSYATYSLPLQINSEKVKRTNDAFYLYFEKKTMKHHRFDGTYMVQKLHKVNDIIIVQLDRFSTYGKNLKDVEVDTELKLGPSYFVNVPKKVPEYELVGFITHVGEEDKKVNEGHFLTYTQNDGGWFTYADNSLDKIESPVKFVLGDVYVLMYKRKLVTSMSSGSTSTSRGSF